MAKVIVMSESGDLFLVPEGMEDEFWEDELEDRDISYAEYLPSLASVKIEEYYIG